MTRFDYLQFIVDFFKEVDEDEEPMMVEFELHESFGFLAYEQATMILEDKEEWSSEWIQRANNIVEHYIQDKN